MSLIIPILQLIVFFSYVIFIITRYGVLKSISHSWYELPRKRRFLFTLFMWIIGISLCFIGSPIYFAGGALICIAGAAGAIKERVTKVIHGISAAGGFVLTLTALFLEGIFFPFIGSVLVLLGLKLTKTHNSIFWSEIVIFLLIQAGFWAKYLGY